MKVAASAEETEDGDSAAVTLARREDGISPVPVRIQRRRRSDSREDGRNDRIFSRKNADRKPSAGRREKAKKLKRSPGRAGHQQLASPDQTILI